MNDNVKLERQLRLFGPGDSLRRQQNGKWYVKVFSPELGCVYEMESHNLGELGDRIERIKTPNLMENYPEVS